MKRIILLGSACLSLAAALGACSSDPEPVDGASGGAMSGGRSNSGGAKATGGKPGTGGKSSGGGSAVTGGGPSTGGAGVGGMGGGMGGDMGGGGMGGAMGGAASAVETACAESCAVTTTIGCTGHEDPVACGQECVAGMNEACEAEYVALKTCEGNDVPSGFQCFGPYLGPSLASACTSEQDAYADCVNP